MGRFNIVIEGLDGTGKSTFAYQLERLLWAPVRQGQTADLPPAESIGQEQQSHGQTLLSAPTLQVAGGGHTPIT